MDVATILIVTLTNTLVGRIDDLISYFIGLVYKIYAFALDAVYDWRYGPSLKYTYINSQHSLDHVPNMISVAMKILIEEYGFKTTEFTTKQNRVIRKPANIGDEKISMRLNTTKSDNKKDEWYSTEMTITSRIHTIETFKEFVARFSNEGFDVIAGPFISVYSGDGVHDDGFALDVPEKVYTAGIVEGIRKVIDSNNRGNILLHGPPGTGKTNIIKSLAHEYNACLYPLNIAEFRNIKELRYRLASSKTYATYHDMATDVYVVPKKRFYLFEDFDSTMKSDFWMNNSKRSAKKLQNDEDDDDQRTKSTMTYSELINLLDGVIRIPNVYTFWTTNHLDQVNPSFRRPGRMHYCGLVNALTLDECKEFIADHYQDCTIPLTRDSVTIAEMYATMTQSLNGNDFVTRLNEYFIDTISGDRQDSIETL